MKIVYKGMLLLAAAVLALAACSKENTAGTASESGKELVLLFNFPADSLDPHVDSTYIPVRAGVAETLVYLNDETLELEPWLAESWESSDRQHWTIRLKDGITFQNGKKMDGAAVKASLERGMSDNPALQSALNIESIQAEGNTVHIKTKSPFAEFPSELVHPNTSIIDVTETNVAEKPVGTGPFKVAAFAPGFKVQLERYADYWDGAAKLDSAVFLFNEDASARTLALQSGEADIVFQPETASLEALRAQPAITVESQPTFRVHQLTMNVASGPLADIHVRKAADALLDRESIVENVLLGLGEPANGPFPSTFPFAPDYPEQKQGKAAAEMFLKQAGYQKVDGVMQKDGKPLAFKLITYNGRPELPLIAQTFQSEAREIGIQTDIQLVEQPEEYMAKNNDWHLSLYSNLTAPRGDAGYYLNATYHPNGALQFGGIQDDQLTAMIERLNRTAEQGVRTEEAKKIASYIDGHVYHSFLVHPNSLVAYNAEKVENWVTTQSEYYMLTNKLDVK